MGERMAEMRRPYSGITAAAAGVLVALLLLSGWGWLVRTVVIDPGVQVLASYLVIWVPLLAACLYASYRRGTRSFARDFGLRITLIDVLLGVGVGLLARVAASIIEIAFFGRMSAFGVRIEQTWDLWWVFGFVLAPVVIAPYIEELFFRGLMQRAVTRTVSRRVSSAVRGGTAIVIAAAVFALVHVAEVTSPTGALVVGLSTFVFGVASGTIAQLTGRIGGSIVAHVTFNGALVLLLLTQ